MLEREAEGSDSLEVSFCLRTKYSQHAHDHLIGYHADAFHRWRNWIRTRFLRPRTTLRHFPQETHPNLLRLPRCRLRRRRRTTLQLVVDAEEVDRVCGFSRRVG